MVNMRGTAGRALVLSDEGSVPFWNVHVVVAHREVWDPDDTVI